MPARYPHPPTLSAGPFPRCRVQLNAAERCVASSPSRAVSDSCSAGTYCWAGFVEVDGHASRGGSGRFVKLLLAFTPGVEEVIQVRLRL